MPYFWKVYPAIAANTIIKRCFLSPVLRSELSQVKDNIELSGGVRFQRLQDIKLQYIFSYVVLHVPPCYVVKHGVAHLGTARLKKYLQPVFFFRSRKNFMSRKSLQKMGHNRATIPDKIC